ncbi:MAG: COX15/CtaA family protein [Neomegalonema sp.]|nr:COX15/CtaA family protein [Neomegalonema sp.]
MSRSIFQEVGGDAPQNHSEPPRSGEATRDGNRRLTRIWVLVLAIMVVAQILIGGLTRITDSGLSITTWSAAGHFLPPLSMKEWEEAFELYKTTTEFKEQNSTMTLAEFKPIFWWEWTHRFWGQLIGLVFIAPFIWLLIKRAIPNGWLAPIAIAGALGGLQGFIGWWMVESGLVGRTDVSQHRLAIHLSIAFVILGLLFWTAFSLKRSDVDLLQARRRRESGMWLASRLLLLGVGVQLFVGAYTSGLNAGGVYGDWPLMDGGLYPASEPFNPFVGQAATQFLHRMVGYLLFAGVAVYFWRARRSAFGKTKLWGAIAFGVITVQMLFGVATLTHGVPTSWAVIHHVAAIMVFVAILHAAHQSAYPAEEKIAG